jgi:hypothetical protein
VCLFISENQSSLIGVFGIGVEFQNQKTKILPENLIKKLKPMKAACMCLDKSVLKRSTDYYILKF